MPAWQDLLSDVQIWQLVDYLKSFSEDFADYPAEQQFVLEGKIDPTPESIARGAAVYEKAECAKCHGATGRGDGPSAATLEDEWEFRIFPANLTQPWTLRGGSSVEDLYRTITTGVNGTPMPSFSDSWQAEDLWHLANYLHSIGRTPVWGEISRAKKSDSIPTDPFDAAWDQAPPLDIHLAGQIIQEPRLFNPSVLSLTVRAIFDDKELALLLTWDDRIENSGDDEPSDRVSVLFSAKELEESKKPYFLMGDRKRPVDSWQWSAASGTETFLSRGMDAVTPRASPVTGESRGVTASIPRAMNVSVPLAGLHCQASTGRLRSPIRKYGFLPSSTSRAGKSTDTRSLGSASWPVFSKRSSQVSRSASSSSSNRARTVRLWTEGLKRRGSCMICPAR